MAAEMLAIDPPLILSIPSGTAVAKYPPLKNDCGNKMQDHIQC